MAVGFSLHFSLCENQNDLLSGIGTGPIQLQQRPESLSAAVFHKAQVMNTRVGNLAITQRDFPV